MPKLNFVCRLNFDPKSCPSHSTLFIVPDSLTDVSFDIILCRFEWSELVRFGHVHAHPRPSGFGRDKKAIGKTAWVVSGQLDNLASYNVAWQTLMTICEYFC